MPTISDCEGALLVGGESRRMGSPKALLEIDGEPLYVHLARTLSTLFDHVAIVGTLPSGMEPPPSLPATCIPDRFPERSSLNGIASALLAARSPWVAVFACDAPRICAELLAYMAGLRHGVEADVFLVADDNGIEQPFHALWRAGAAGRIEEAILRGELGIRRLIAGMKTRIITPNEWRRFDSTGTFITNINTPDQWRDYIGSEDSGPT